MPRSLSGRNFLKLLDFTTEEIQYLLELSKDFKRLKRTNTPHKYLTGKNIVLLFEKTSTRTRCSFEVAGNDLGMGVTYLDPASSQMGNKESLEDTAKVLGRMFDGIEYRGFDQKIVEDLGRYAGVPVWNGLTTEFHPTQMLADVLTIEENFGRYKGLKMVFMGDARNNVANSLMVVSAKLGINFVACGPKDNMPDEALVATCREIAKNKDNPRALSQTFTDLFALNLCSTLLIAVVFCGVVLMSPRLQDYGLLIPIGIQPIQGVSNVFAFVFTRLKRRGAQFNCHKNLELNIPYFPALRQPSIAPKAHNGRIFGIWMILRKPIIRNCPHGSCMN